jgi:hypothetical protein
MTHAEAMAHQARVLHQRGLSVEGGGVDKESELHREILDHCRRMGWIAFHGSMAHQTFRTPGEPDFILLLGGGRLLMIECKTGTGKLSTDQAAIHAWADRLGHTIFVVRNFEQFLNYTK